MHEYGLLPSINSNDSDDGNIFADGETDNSLEMLFGGVKRSSKNSLSPSVQFDPIEYGAVLSKYREEELIFSENMSSTKIYLMKNVETKEVSNLSDEIHLLF